MMDMIIKELDNIVQRNKDKIVVSIIVIAIIVILLKTFIFKLTRPADLKIDVYQTSQQSTDASSKDVTVMLNGAVNRPGEYTLDNKSMVVDLIAKAGGVTSQADMSKINVVKKLEDGLVIEIPQKSNVKRNSNDPSLININTASSDQLQIIPGLGKKYAQNIIDYRDEHGTFSRIEDLTNVKGIGIKRLKKIKKYISL